MSDIEDKYNELLSDFEYVLGKGTTYSNDLDKVGKGIFGNRFIGIYSSDKIPILKNGDLLIANLDKSNQPGSHWVSIAKKNNKVYFYDSFGRPYDSIMPSIKGLGVNEQKDLDPEQNKIENNCGQRSLAWLCILDLFSPDKALMI